MKRYTSVFALILVIAIAMSTAGCKSCKKAEGEAEAPPPLANQDLVIATSPAQVTGIFGARLPAESMGILVIRDFHDLLVDYSGLRARAGALIGDIGTVEGDLRNTLGIDPSHPETLVDIGVAPAGGAVIAPVLDQPILGLVLSDPHRFETHITQTLQAQPFDLDGEVERIDIEDARLILFRSEESELPEFAAAIHQGIGYLLPSAGRAEECVRALVAVTEASSMASTGGFEEAVSSFEGYPVFGFIAAGQAADRVQAEFAELLGPAGLSVVERIRDMNGVAYGMRLAGNRLDARAVLLTDEGTLATWNSIVGSVESNPSFARLLNPDVYALVRGTGSLEEGLAAARRELAPEMAEALNGGLLDLSELVGLSIEEELIPALGSHAMLLATRARLLTLRRVLNSRQPNIGEAFTAFGAVIALEVDDPAPVEAAIRAAATALEARATLTGGDGEPLVLAFNDAQVDVGNIVLTDELLLLVPERNRSDLLEALAAGGGSIDAIRDTAAQRLITETVANGFLLDFARIMDGPIGAALGPMLPDELEEALGNLDQMHGTVESSEQGIVANVTVLFSPIDDTP